MGGYTSTLEEGALYWASQGHTSRPWYRQSYGDIFVDLPTASDIAVGNHQSFPPGNRRPDTAADETSAAWARPASTTPLRWTSVRAHHVGDHR
jgi:hypothetical protein